MTERVVEMKTDRLMTPAEVAAWLAVPVRTLESWRTRGKGEGPAYTRLGASKLVRYRRAAVEAWLATRDVCGAGKEQAG